MRAGLLEFHISFPALLQLSEVQHSQLWRRRPLYLITHILPSIQNEQQQRTVTVRSTWRSPVTALWY